MIIICGCGGTGSNLAPMLSRMLKDETFILIDGDLVEDKNIERQTFQKFDVGSNKARALAKKLNSNFSNKHLYIDKYIETKEDVLKLITDSTTGELLVPNQNFYICGCFDNNASRLILEDLYKHIQKLLKDFKGNVHYIDSGNEDNFGTVIVDICRSEFMDMSNDENPANHCANQITSGNLQQYQINLDMALAVAKVVFAIETKKEYPACIKINGFSRTVE